uniref:DUF1778 domain-containing protein n=1 Tax=Bosea sp. NBC_00436 TaxID=2969620 RepID=A0A9E7ZK86_9HYPH
MEREENPISTHLRDADRAMIDRAARLHGWSRAGFVRAANEVLTNNCMICMNLEGFADFLEVLSVLAAPVVEIVELAKRPAPWEAGYIAKR